MQGLGTIYFAGGDLRRPRTLGAFTAPLLAAEGSDLIFDAKLLPLKFRDDDVVGVGSVLFFVNQMFEFSVLGPQRFHVLCHGHARASDLCPKNYTWGC
jgi:hypothetical protein